MNDQDEQQQITVAQMLRVVSDVLGRRVQQWAVLLLAFGLYGAVVYDPNWIKLAAAVAFSLVALYLFRKERA